jgi:putative ABC transport system ATP-binding protein
MRLIRSVAHGEGITAIVATHDNALIELADRVLELKDGREPAGRHAGLSTRKPAVRAAVDSSAS